MAASNRPVATANPCSVSSSRAYRWLSDKGVGLEFTSRFPGQNGHTISSGIGDQQVKFSVAVQIGGDQPPRIQASPIDFSRLERSIAVAEQDRYGVVVIGRDS